MLVPSFSSLLASSLLLLNVSGVFAHPGGSPNNGLTCVPGRRAAPDQQSANFARFVQTLFVQKNVAKGFNEHALESYIQHNPDMLSGRNTSIAYLSENAPHWTITIAHQGFDNGIGFIHWKLSYPPFGAQDFMVVADFFRYEGSCIAEHWDSIQPAPPADRVNPLPII